MASNLKRLVRTRMAETGQSYQGALRDVRAAETEVDREMKAPTVEHVCHADGCGVAVSPRMLMCLRHWRMLPKPAQRIIWREYRPGQERDKVPSAAYLVAQSVAVMLVALKEERFTVKQGVDFLGKRWVGLPICLGDAEVIYREMLA